MISTANGGRPLSARVAFLIAGAIGSAGWSSCAAAAAAPTISSGSFERQDSVRLLPSQARRQGDGRLALVMPVISKLSLALAGIAHWMENCSDDFGLQIDLILYIDPEEAQAYNLETRPSSHAALLDMVTCFEDFKVVTGENVSK